MKSIRIGDPAVDLEKFEDQAVLLMEGGKLRRAERILLGLLEYDPNFVPAHFYLTRVYRRTQQYNLALRHGRRTLRLRPNETNAHLVLGMIYEEMGRDSLAARHYLKELANNPTSPESLCYLGKLYFKNHQWKRASKRLRRCLELGFLNDLEDTVHKLGNCYHRLHDIKSYVEIYTRYLEMEPRAGWAASNLGGALLHSRDFQRAVLVLTKANRLKQTSDVASKLERARKCLRGERLATAETKSLRRTTSPTTSGGLRINAV